VIRFAVIADPHVHDCDWVPTGSGLPGAIRSFGETGQSTRIFNESVPAFRAALTAAVEAGAKIVVLVGDLTDDGQRPNIDKALSIIAEFRKRHGLRVLMTPGNHDFFAIDGRPQRKTFLAADGMRVAVDSAASAEAATLGSGEALQILSGLGFTPDAADRHWETPFGHDPDWQARSYRTTSPNGHTACDMIDASYLVEPVDGLWVLSIDANVCIPRDDATDFTDSMHFLDPSKLGWDVVAKHRPHLLGWITDVASRARRLGKHLVAFSHYPPLDVLGNSAATEIPVFGANGLAQRIPDPSVAEALAATGIKLHFSGHLHVNDTARYRSTAGGFVNIAVPSPVGYGAGLKIIDMTPTATHVRTLPLRRIEGHDIAFAAYRAEAAHMHRAAPAASKAVDHGQFLNRHLCHLVRRRYLPREWPSDLEAFVQNAKVSDLLKLLGVTLPVVNDFSMLCMVEDWYRFRKAGALALPDIAAERVALYQRLVSGPRAEPETELAARMAVIVDLLGLYMNRQPSIDFAIMPNLDIIEGGAEQGRAVA